MVWWRERESGTINCRVIEHDSAQSVGDKLPDLQEGDNVRVQFADEESAGG